MWGIAAALSGQVWIDAAAFERVIESTIFVFEKQQKNPQAFTIDQFPVDLRARACRWLNDTISVSLAAQFLQVYGWDAEQLKKDAAGALRYFQNVNKLRALGFENYETISTDLFEQLRQFSASGDEIAPAYSPHRSWQHWERTFYPEVLGLYYGLFEVEPTASTAAPKSPDSHGISESYHSPALEFLSEIILETGASDAFRRLQGTAKNFGIDFETWTYGEMPALRNKVAKWKKHPKEARAEGKRWRVIGEQYAATFRSCR